MIHVDLLISGADWAQTEQAKAVLDSLSNLIDEDGKQKVEIELKLEDFVQFTRRHKMLLFPAFKLQSSLRNKVLGDKFWKEV